jgi:hypothetical protein
MTIIYGVDTTQSITPLQVRDAITECFTQAHCQDSGIPDTNLNRPYCLDLIKKFIQEKQGNYEAPTKQDLLQLVDSLIEFSKNFRDPSIVTSHTAEIQTLLDLLP